MGCPKGCKIMIMIIIQEKKITAGIIVSISLKLCESGRSQKDTDLETKVKVVTELCSHFPC